MAIRIYTQHIQVNKEIVLHESHANYLFKVMRQSESNQILLFNKQEGEFECTILQISAKKCVVNPLRLVRSFVQNTTLITCVFSVIKQKNIELIVQKCTEIGVNAFLPLLTTRCTHGEVNYARLLAIATEAAEQCGRLDIPEISKAIKLSELEGLKQQGGSFVLLHHSEHSHISHLNKGSKRCFIISGPEGGFTNEEIEFMGKFATIVGLSPNILRAETAAILGCGLAALLQ